MTIDTFLHNGDVPQIGFGPGLGFTKYPERYTSSTQRLLGKLQKIFFPKTYKSQEREYNDSVYIKAIADAFKNGYRLLDYSASYGNGVLVGKGLVESSVPREKLIITSRVSNQAQFSHNILNEVLTQIKNLGVGYLDVLMFHWPVTDLYLSTWKEMEKLVESGLVKNLGVANCHQHHIESILNMCKYKPVVGQFEIHPLFSQKSLIDFYKENDIIVEAYTPLARYDDRLIRLPLLKELEKKYSKSLVQIILRWHIQNGCIPLVRCMSEGHQKENIDIFDFVLSDEDMHRIDSININSRLRYDPDNCDFSIL